MRDERAGQLERFELKTFEDEPAFVHLCDFQSAAVIGYLIAHDTSGLRQMLQFVLLL